MLSNCDLVSNVSPLLIFCRYQMKCKSVSNVSPRYTLQPGARCELGQHCYPVTAVGSVAEQNLRELGHITLRFDGLREAEFPGTVHVAGPVPDDIAPGCILTFVA